MDTADLTGGLRALLGQFDAAFPNRDHASDGTIGDPAHKLETSGHNLDDTPGSKAEWNDGDGRPEVRALDVDSDLRAPGVSMQQVINHLRALPDQGKHIRYMIYNRVIYQASNGWRPEPYTGPSAHTEHAHFSGQRLESADNDTTFNYRLTDLTGDIVTETDMSTIASKVVAALTARTPLNGPDGKPDGTYSTPVGAAVLAQGVPDGTDPDGGRVTVWQELQHIAQRSTSPST